MNLISSSRTRILYQLMGWYFLYFVVTSSRDAGANLSGINFIGVGEEGSIQEPLWTDTQLKVMETTTQDSGLDCKMAYSAKTLSVLLIMSARSWRRVGQYDILARHMAIGWKQCSISRHSTSVINHSQEVRSKRGDPALGIRSDTSVH